MRRVSTLVGLSLVLLSPVLLAQSAAPAPQALAACLTCHGPAAEGVPQAAGGPAIPRVGGQHAEYLIKQMREYKAGKRKNDLMSPMLAKISNRDLRELATHFAGQAASPPATQSSPAVERGRALYEQGTATVPGCIGCHLPNAVGAPRYPRLAGQRQAYVIQQLTNFKQGARTNDRARVMRNIAANLNEEEMIALAEYLSSLRTK